MVIDDAIDEYERDPSVGVIDQMRVIATGCCDDQAGNMAIAHPLDDAQLPLIIVVRVTQERNVTALREPVFDTSEDWREERVRKVGKDQADCR